MRTSTLFSSLGLLSAAMIWGGLFPVAKAALVSIDPFVMTLIRYGSTAIILLCLLLAIEGRNALRLEGRGWRLWLHGSFGFAGFSLCVFIGLQHARPEHAAIVIATMPLLAALLNAIVQRRLPSAFTATIILLAFSGVLISVSRGHPAELLRQGAGGSELLIMLGALSWVIYTRGAEVVPSWSALRYTAVSCMLGVTSIVVALVIAQTLGLSHWPSAAQLLQFAPELSYIVVGASVLAVLFWNQGVRTLGAVNGILFSNLVPVTAIVIGLLQGHALSTAELAGAGVTVSALLLHYLYLQGWFNRQVQAPVVVELSANELAACGANQN